jgi:hypothetical protein
MEIMAEKRGVETTPQNVQEKRDTIFFLDLEKKNRILILIWRAPKRGFARINENYGFEQPRIVF